MLFCNLSQKVLRNKVFWLLFLLTAASLVYLNQFTLELRDPHLTDADGKQTAITLPYVQDMPENVEFIISGRIFYIPSVSADTVQIIPDDKVLSIRVNNRDIPLDSVDPASLSDYNNGFHFNLGRYLQGGYNYFEIKIKNGGGPAGLFFQNSQYDIRTLAMDLLFMISLSAMLYLILSCFISNKTAVIIILGGFLARALYFFVTSYGLRTHDVYEHLAYIEYIVGKWALPPKKYSAETYQPPLYYITAALIYKAANLLGITNTLNVYRILQFFSLLLSMGFIGATLLIFNMIVTYIFNSNRETGGFKVKKDRLTSLMLAIVVFWPSNIMHSVRISNEPMFYCVYAWGLAFLAKWYYDNKPSSMYTGIIVTALCMITKASGVILYAIAGLIFLLKFIKERNFKKYLIRAAVVLVILGAAFWLTLGDSLTASLKGSKEHFMVGGGNEQGKIGNKLHNYTYFNLPEFIYEPYMEPWTRQEGRELFWNYLLKTSVFGEWGFGSLLHQSLARAINVLFLGVLFYAVIGLILILITEFRQHIILSANFGMLLACAILIRISIPAACLNDFRFIVPILISFGFFYGYTTFFFRRKGWVPFEVTGYILAVLFIVATSVFIVGLQFCGFC